MQSVVLSALPVVVGLFPVALIVALLQLSSRRQRARLAEVARQIAVTDAIHAELGAVVAPVVRRRLWGRWQVMIPVPLERPDTVTRVVEAAYGVFGEPERTRPGRFEIVLRPQEQPVPRRDQAMVAARAARGESVSWT